MFQGKIEIADGKIVNLIPKENSLLVIINGKTQNFGNSYAFLGFTDSHLHLLYGGEFLTMPDLSKARSEEECIEIIRQKPFYRGEWIFARGWNQENWKEKDFPTKDSLDRAFPFQPVCLIRQDGHCLWVNSKAMEICNINEKTPDPKGGKIVRCESGKPNGILIDEAIELVRPKLPNYSTEQYFYFLQQSINFLTKYGITTVHDMDVDPNLLKLYYDYFSSNSPKINVKIFLSGKRFEEFNQIFQGSNNKYLEVVGLKYYLDGAFGSFGALLNEPYSDHPLSSGLQLLSEEELFEAFKITAENKLGIAIHSIGDKATNIILNAYEKFINFHSKTPKFIRIEHCQLVQPTDIPRFNKLGIFASIQPIHFLSDFEMARSRLGKRTKFAYPWKSFLANDVIICSGSDFPIENPDPIQGISLLVNRNSFDKDHLFGFEEISIENAINSYTLFPYISISQTHSKLEIGGVANITILSHNPFKIPKKEIPTIKIVGTIIQGEIIYSL
ncbi:MAG: amidohydrolase [Ignavibacteria bacterium]|nr:amidohydrolase [Ignavibacteria bacterium]